jgi:hypothetical protein
MNKQVLSVFSLAAVVLLTFFSNQLFKQTIANTSKRFAVDYYTLTDTVIDEGKQAREGSLQIIPLVYEIGSDAKAFIRQLCRMPTTSVPSRYLFLPIWPNPHEPSEITRDTRLVIYA